MTNPLYVVDIFSEVVTSVMVQVLTTIQSNEQTALGGTLIKTIDYQYGHIKELLETLKQMDANKTLQLYRFPLVYLIMDFTERRGLDRGIYADLALNIIIAHQTEMNYKADERYKYVFKPVLYPIYYSLLDQLAQKKGIEQYDENLISHTKIDRVYWGKNTMANSLNDYVDAIEISNLNLKLNLTSCLTV
jgi:hypothetical protein